MSYLPRAAVVVAMGLVASLALAGLAWASGTADPKPAAGAITPSPVAPAADVASRDVVVHASSLPKSALSEWMFWDDPLSPGGRLVGTPNSGGNLDPPPEDDPHVTFKIQVQGGVPYRCWMHMKVGSPKGLSKANKCWLQFSNAVDTKGKDRLKPGTGSYLTAEGPTQQGWAWVACTASSASSASNTKSQVSLVSFRASGEVTVRIQAGMEGVGFDQLVLSPVRFLEQPPAVAVVGKP